MRRHLLKKAVNIANPLWKFCRFPAVAEIAVAFEVFSVQNRLTILPLGLLYEGSSKYIL